MRRTWPCRKRVDRRGDPGAVGRAVGNVERQTVSEARLACYTNVVKRQHKILSFQVGDNWDEVEATLALKPYAHLRLNSEQALSPLSQREWKIYATSKQHRYRNKAALNN